MIVILYFFSSSVTHFHFDRTRTSLDAIKVITNDKMSEIIPKSSLQSENGYNAQMKGKRDEFVATRAHKGRRVIIRQETNSPQLQNDLIQSRSVCLCVRGYVLMRAERRDKSSKSNGAKSEVWLGRVCVCDGGWNHSGTTVDCCLYLMLIPKTIYGNQTGRRERKTDRDEK